METIKLGKLMPMQSLRVVRRIDKVNKTIADYAKCSVCFAYQDDFGNTTEGFVVNDNGKEIFFARPNHYEAIGLVN